VDAERAVERDGLRVASASTAQVMTRMLPSTSSAVASDTCCAGRERCLGREEPPPINHEALDVRRRHRLGAQEEPGQRFGVDKRLGRGVQCRDRPLGSATSAATSPSRRKRRPASRSGTYASLRRPCIRRQPALPAPRSSVSER
jgi:hypothetical protein